MNNQKKTRIVVVMTFAVLFTTSCNNQQNQNNTNKTKDTIVIINVQQTPQQEVVEVKQTPQQEVTKVLEQPQETKLTYAKLAGMYDTPQKDGESIGRIVLNNNGTATLGMVGSLHHSEFTYTIQGNTICMRMKGFDSELSYYKYNASSRSLKSKDGVIYYYQ